MKKMGPRVAIFFFFVLFLFHSPQTKGRRANGGKKRIQKGEGKSYLGGRMCEGGKVREKKKKKTKIFFPYLNKKNFSNIRENPKQDNRQSKAQRAQNKVFFFFSRFIVTLFPLLGQVGVVALPLLVKGVCDDSDNHEANSEDHSPDEVAGGAGDLLALAISVAILALVAGTAGA